MFDSILSFIRSKYPLNNKIHVHEPYMGRLEEEYVVDCIRSGFVSSIGEYVEKVEKKIAKFTGVKHAVAVSSGTAALHTALVVSGVKEGDLVLTQSLSFVATANAIKYCNADPFFIDIDKNSLSISIEKLEEFLEKEVEVKDSYSIHKKSKKRIFACVPMHTFGHISKIDELCELCCRYNISVVEDAAEAMGSFYKKRHAGTFGDSGIISFNGNKIITSGGGGVIVTNSDETARLAKHLSTTARKENSLCHAHDMIGFNYRMPNINASFLMAQLDQLDLFLKKKQILGKEYESVCNSNGIDFFKEPDNCKSNYWLNSIILKNRQESELFLKKAQSNGIFPRMVWKPLHMLDIFQKEYIGDMENTESLYNRIINLPSSVPREE